MTLLSPSPVDHRQIDPDCFGCWLAGGSCSDVCGVCGCRWESDDEPNTREEWCSTDCDCHRPEFAEQRAAERRDDGLEAAWRDQYADSFAAWQAEGR